MTADKPKASTSDGGKVHVTSLVTQDQNQLILDDDAPLDEQTLGALGYRQEFKR